MKCERCGGEISERASFCPHCGAPRPRGEGSASPSEGKRTEQAGNGDRRAGGQGSAFYPAPKQRPPKRGFNGKGALILALALLLSALLGAGSFFMFRYFTEDSLLSEESSERGKGEGKKDREGDRERDKRRKRKTERDEEEEDSSGGKERKSGEKKRKAERKTSEGKKGWERMLPTAESSGGEGESPKPENESDSESASPALTESEPPSDSGGFILPDSDSRYYSAEEISGLTKEELRIARNEIYARRGRIFSDSGLRTYFEGKDWYHGSIEAGRFSDDQLNDFEKKNRDLIKAREEQLGG
ncbi:YARHG domain-containing protein [Oribacterium sp. oral taxon 078]|uniref:YARHG domain-containing protein n=1 Tax=Oribacterium sp. oral taxon 078 TaxID=652706 RepID=UPI000404D906|nr:YARHG domain-containing protein [Oribacterium sp. oral taxon 078]